MSTMVVPNSKPRTGMLNTAILVCLIVIAIFSLCSIERHILAIEHPSVQPLQIVTVSSSSTNCFSNLLRWDLGAGSWARVVLGLR